MAGLGARPRVLIVTADYPPQPGGIATVMVKLAQHLPVEEVRVVALGPALTPEPPANAVAPVSVRRVGRGADIPRFRMAALAAAALAEARVHRPDVMLLSHVAVAPIGSAVRRLLSIPTVLYAHADEFGVWPRRCASAVRGVDAVIAVSRHSADLAADAGTPPARLHIVPNGVDPPRHRPPPTDRRPVVPTVLTVSRMTDLQKGHDVLLRALPLVRARIPEVQWVVVGDGPLRPTLESLASGLGVKDAIRFTGVVTDLERDDWFDRADVFAMPTRVPAGGRGGEGFGIVYLEAAARGLPVIAAAEGGALDAVESGRNGLLIDPRDHVELAETLIALLRDHERARAMGRAGRLWAQQFAWRSVAARVAEVLAGVSDRGEPQMEV